MGAIVTFDYASWVAGFPQFATIPQTQVEGFILDLAEQYCRNDGGGPVNKPASQTNLLNLMVAHICALFYGVNGDAPSPLVGRISGATEGSVSVQTDFPSTPSNDWFNQTPWGAAFWVASSAYRTMRYVAGCGYGYAGGRGVWPR